MSPSQGPEMVHHQDRPHHRPLPLHHLTLQPGLHLHRHESPDHHKAPGPDPASEHAQQHDPASPLHLHRPASQGGGQGAPGAQDVGQGGDAQTGKEGVTPHWQC